MRQSIARMRSVFFQRSMFRRKNRQRFGDHDSATVVMYTFASESMIFRPADLDPFAFARPCVLHIWLIDCHATQARSETIETRNTDTPRLSHGRPQLRLNVCAAHTGLKLIGTQETTQLLKL